MIRVKLAVLLVLTLLFGAACSGKKPLSAEAKQGASVLSVLQELAASYEARNAPSFMNKVAERFEKRNTLEKEIEGVFRAYPSVRFTVQKTRLLIVAEYRSDIMATFTWDAEWKTANGRTIRDGGRATLRFSSGDPLLVGIEGRNPFVPAEKKGK